MPENFEDFESVNSKVPFTIASANTIAPKSRFTRITGIISIQNIIPPLEIYHELCFTFIDTNFDPQFIIGGNIQFPDAVTGGSVGLASVITLFYDPRFKKYYMTGSVAFS